MLRRLVEEIGLFLIPFGVFFLFLLLAGRNPLRREQWDGRMLRLVGIGIGVVIVSLVADGLFSTREAGGYVPPHMENGRLVPGRFD